MTAAVTKPLRGVWRMSADCRKSPWSSSEFHGPLKLQPCIFPRLGSMCLASFSAIVLRFGQSQNRLSPINSPAEMASLYSHLRHALKPKFRALEIRSIIAAVAADGKVTEAQLSAELDLFPSARLDEITRYAEKCGDFIFKTSWKSEEHHGR